MTLSSCAAAMSLLNPLRRHTSYVSTRNYSNDASGVTRDLRLISDTAPPWTTRLLRGEFEHAPWRSSLMSAQGGRPPLEVYCCDSRFDKYLTSPRSAGMFQYRGDLDTGQQKQQAPSGLLKGVGRLTSCVHLWRPNPQVIFTDHANIQWVVGQCMPALVDSRKNADYSHEPQPFISKACVSTRCPE